MGRPEFVHLHVHSHFSLLDGCASVPALLDQVAELGMRAVALTDHGVMHATVPFYRGARARGIKPILGCEVYVAPGSRHTRGEREESPFHLTLLAENQEGYKNLLRLVSLAFLEGYYYKPRVDQELLERYHEGLIATTGCLSGQVPRLLLRGEEEAALRVAAGYRDLFGPGRYFVELQSNGVDGQERVNAGLLRLAARLGLPLLATNDVHYLRQEDAAIQEILVCIQTGKTLQDHHRLRFASDQFYLKSPEEMERLFAPYPEALRNTVAVAERCQVELDFDTLHLPDFPVPQGETPGSYLRRLCAAGLSRRYGSSPPPEADTRLERELAVIEGMGFTSYFLVVWDFIRFAREQGIAVGPGRGSAAGSLVAYLLDITDVDPLRYGLLFERFLNPERVSLPDIDVDFADDRRDEVIQYVTHRYGPDRVAQIVTFGTMAARAAIRDVGRVLNLPYREVDRIAKLVPPGPGVTLEEALRAVPELAARARDDRNIDRLLRIARAVEGSPRHASVHAAGVVIGSGPLVEHVPLQRSADGAVVTQFPMEDIEALGLLKMDFLGLRNLTVLQRALAQVRDSYGETVELSTIPHDDPAVYEMLTRGETLGVFQMESSLFKRILAQIAPTCFEDIIATISLGRPGPMVHLEEFCRRRHGRAPVTYLHPALEPILKSTYGILLYQEQVMQVAQQLAGYSPGEADLLRRAMGKKKPEVMERERERFVAGAVARGIEQAVAEAIFADMARFAGYGFNRSHAAAYALIAYQTAWLKARYPAPFMAALLSSVMEHSDRVALYLEAARRLGIEVLPPDINESDLDFTVREGKIRFGLGAVKNVGTRAIESILAARADRPFTSLFDFCRRIDHRLLNRKMVESLIKAGAFDSLGRREALLQALDRAFEVGQRRREEAVSGQASLLGTLLEPAAGVAAAAADEALPDVPPLPLRERLRLEREVLGFYLSGHPVQELADRLAACTAFTAASLRDVPDGTPVSVGGAVAQVRRLRTRRGEPMCLVVLEDLTGSVEVTLFPAVAARFGAWLEEGRVLVVSGRADQREQGVSVVAESLVPAEGGWVEIPLGPGAPPGTLASLKEVLSRHRGERPVLLLLEDGEKGKRTVVATHPDYWVEPGAELDHSLQQLGLVAAARSP